MGTGRKGMRWGLQLWPGQTPPPAQWDLGTPGGWREGDRDRDRPRARAGDVPVCEPAEDAGFCDCTEGDLRVGARKRLCAPVCRRAEPVSTSRHVPECADVPATNIY